MHHFPASEEYGKLDFVPFFEEFSGVANFDIPVVVVNFGTQADFFEDNCVLLFLTQLNFALLLIKVFAEVHNSAYRRGGVGGHLHKIQSGFLRFVQCLLDADNTDLHIIFINQADRTGANPIVYP